MKKRSRIKKAMRNSQNVGLSLLGRSDRYDPGSPQALTSLRFDAAVGDPHAQAILGAYLLHGCHMPRNADEGMRWLKLSVGNGYAIAALLLAFAHFEGEGVAQDCDEGRNWLFLAGSLDPSLVEIALVPAGIPPESLRDGWFVLPGGAATDTHEFAARMHTQNAA